MILRDKYWFRAMAYARATGTEISERLVDLVAQKLRDERKEREQANEESKESKE